MWHGGTVTSIIGTSWKFVHYSQKFEYLGVVHIEMHLSHLFNVSTGDVQYRGRYFVLLFEGVGNNMLKINKNAHDLQKKK
ncbi:unnamed protein product [Acanthoscelides obtectus]|uniref:Uncharacterized protein n=1 Tax=Acanthoscelides obtectus TaxID=200917 RepID=A0A9P0Q010_ACAOB|nr:unnamed protein product [Acanthoscelides obtectus]CAK1623237.1 hypothetical protein AOBTE_LOCUS1900 [Acanthoscelides obtectus]